MSRGAGDARRAGPTFEQTVDERILYALGLSTLAGLSTGIGGAIVAFSKARHTKVLAGGLGLSAGVMIYVSFVEMFPEALERIGQVTTERWAHVWTAVAFFAGMGLIAVIDAVVPEQENPHMAPGAVDSGTEVRHAELRRVGLMTAIAVGVHNFPEGFATFVSAYEDWRMGLPIAVAIGLHNIPEGIAIAVPVLFATGDPKRAFTWALLSGIAEPIGALVGWLVLGAILDDLMMGVSFAAIAGIMVFISLDQLIPNSRRYDAGHVPMYGLVLGMAVMALTLALL